VSPIPRFVVVLDRAGCHQPLTDVATLALAGGADIIQIREKQLAECQLRVEIEAVLSAVIDSSRISINGRPDLAREYNTHLHLPEIISMPGYRLEDRLISRSVHLPLAQPVAGVDYLVLGNLLPTGSKPGLPGIGFDDFRAAVSGLTTPVLAIGGIEPGTVAPSLDAGAFGVVVRSAVIGARDPYSAAQAIRKEIDAWTMSNAQSPSSSTVNRAGSLTA
jgi:thiazole tautomerase (transcriptional regulator TenI)